MFRRKWSVLPADADFPSNIKDLGYFINEDDEIRSIENPNNYWDYFISRNERWNERQRYAMQQATRVIVRNRLKELGLQQHVIPLGTTNTSDPHLPIFASKDIAKASRIVIVFGESTQDFGVLAQRVLGGQGGVDKGSVVSIVKSLLTQEKYPPAIILANCGQLMWLPSEKKTLTPWAWQNTRMKSAVHAGNFYHPEVNSVPGNRTVPEHVQYIFEQALPTLTEGNEVEARIDIIGVGDSADVVEQYLDKEEIWTSSGLGQRLNCMAVAGGTYPIWDVQTDGLKQFLRDKSRNYALSMEPAGTVLSGPDGNPRTRTFTDLGTLVLSSGEVNYTECTLIRAADIVLEFLHEVSLCTTTISSDSENGNTKDGKAKLVNTFKNPSLVVTYEDPMFDENGTGDTWNDWEPSEMEGGPEGSTVHGDAAPIDAQHGISESENGYPAMLAENGTRDMWNDWEPLSMEGGPEGSTLHGDAAPMDAPHEISESENGYAAMLAAQSSRPDDY